MKWFRVYSEIIDDPKLKELNDFEFRVWFLMLAYACEKGELGHLKGATTDSLAWRLRVKKNIMSRVLDKLLRLKLISKDKEEYYVTNWKKRQYASDNVTERVQKHRADETLQKRYRNVTETANETPPEPDTEPEPDSDTDTDIKTIPTPSIVENKKLVSGLVNSILKKSSGNRTNGSDKTIFVGLLIKIGIPKGTALNYTERYPLDYLARKIVQFEYIKTTDQKLTNPVGYLRTIIEHDKYPPPEEFFEYAKTRAQKLIDSNIHAMQILGSYL